MTEKYSFFVWKKNELELVLLKPTNLKCINPYIAKSFCQY